MMNDNKFKKVCRFLLASIAIITCSPAISQDIKGESAWVDSVFATLDTDKKIGQLMMIPAYAGRDTEHYTAIKNLIRNYNVGGVVFLEGGPVAQAKLTNDLQGLSNIPLLIAMDVEWGLGMKLDSTLSFPIAMSLGTLRDDSLLHATGKMIGNQLKSIGVHMNFSPVVDINTNPSNPVIGMRSFSDNPQQVYNKARTFSDGLREAGILPVIKHFPGHGDTEVDIHLGLPVLKASRQVINNRELFPFKKFADDNVEAIMAGHLYAPNILNDGLPVSLSPNFLKNIIRTEWKYDGLIISDALNIEAIAGNFKKGQAEEFALIAGNDILLFPDNIPAAIRRIKRALRRGELSEPQIDASVKRVLRTKYMAGLHGPANVDTTNLVLALNAPEAHLLKRDLALNAITLLKNEGNLLPIKTLDEKSFGVINFGPQDTWQFTDYLNKYTRFSVFNGEETTDILEKLGAFDVIIAGIFSSDLEEQKLQQLEMLSSQTNLLIAVFGSPYTLQKFNNFNNVVWIPEQTFLSQQLLPQLIFGAETFNGVFPLEIGTFARGTGITTESLNRFSFTLPEAAGLDGDHLKKIDELIEGAIRGRATPGAQVLVARHGKVIWEKSYGYHSYDSLIPVNEFTLFDLASVTKVTASVASLMMLYDHGLIDLDKKVSFYLPDLEGTNKENMTLRDILTHQAGLWPYLPFYKSTMASTSHLPMFYRYHPQDGFLDQVSSFLYVGEPARDSVWQWVKDSKVIEKKPRETYEYRYSDMGYYIIHRIIEKLINQPMQHFLNQNLYDPAGMVSLDYNPLCHYPQYAIAPTEMDDYYRFELIHGFVHDQGAALVGGVAGHAGLFSNALDLGKYMQLLLQKGSYGGKQYFKPETIELFTRQQYESNRRGLGWDKPVKDDIGGPTSEYVSGDTFGHTGFTGTAAWTDPEFGLVYIFLSNRVHPNAMNTKLISDNVRTRIQDIIYQAMFRKIQYEKIQ